MPMFTLESRELQFEFMCCEQALSGGGTAVHAVDAYRVLHRLESVDAR